MGISHNVGDGKNHILKIVCGRGKNSGPKGPRMKYAMKKWLEFYDIDHICSLYHGVYFINVGLR